MREDGIDFAGSNRDDLVRCPYCKRAIMVTDKRRVGATLIGLLLLLVTLTGCVLVGHVTNNFPPGRNEVGAGARNVNDFYLYSDTGEATKNEQSYFGADIALSRDAPVIVPAGPPAPDTTPGPSQ